MKRTKMCLVLGQRWDGFVYADEVHRLFYPIVHDIDYAAIAARVRHIATTVSYTEPSDRETGVESIIYLCESIRVARQLSSQGYNIDVRLDHNGHTMSMLDDDDTVVSLTDIVNRYPEASVFRIGGQPQRTVFTNNTLVTEHPFSPADDYPHIPALQPLFGRRVAAVNVYNSEQELLPDYVAKVLNNQIVYPHTDGAHKTIILKAIGPRKQHLETVSYEEKLTAHNLFNPLYDLFYNCNQLDTYLFAQQRLDMRYEMRALVTNGRVVSIAGNVENLCPIDIPVVSSQGNPHVDNRVERYRNDGVDVSNPVVAAQLYDFASQTAATLAHDSACPRTYVLDVAISHTPDGDQPVVVELNNPTMSGLYANDPVTTGWLRDVIIERITEQHQCALTTFTIPQQTKEYQ